MSGYTLGEIIVWLLLAAFLGFVLGWLLRELKYRSQDGTAAESMTSSSAPAVIPGRFPGSAKPLAGGTAPSADYSIKGNEKSMIYHSPASPSYERTTAEVWFRSEVDAIAAGFRKPRNM